ncbi:hypothetical protein E2C01_023940 [Portunus trituberculatus]|uniref:Uncharacterized protein n=1 Tax=Portunus trituberculatus TaxID=210409 RepID=A0A5B7E9F4_PORTR|nr:hypothetical protein [Portunus trituberculatus]
MVKTANNFGRGRIKGSQGVRLWENCKVAFSYNQVK